MLLTEGGGLPCFSQLREQMSKSSLSWTQFMDQMSQQALGAVMDQQGVESDSWGGGVNHLSRITFLCLA